MKTVKNKHLISIYILGCIFISLLVLPMAAPSEKVLQDSQISIPNETDSEHTRKITWNQIPDRGTMMETSEYSYAEREPEHIMNSRLFHDLNSKMGEELKIALEESLEDQNIDPESLTHLRDSIQNLPPDGVLHITSQ